MWHGEFRLTHSPGSFRLSSVMGDGTTTSATDKDKMGNCFEIEFSLSRK